MAVDIQGKSITDVSDHLLPSAFQPDTIGPSVGVVEQPFLSLCVCVSIFRDIPLNRLSEE